ncbi:carbonic anhydrase [Sphingomonas sp. MMS24-J13]|uniref:carbonic anhydrase n=1 Tax=Sphingomonas sp. MMS24-J13 TaxID=3238686 RepID=UPI00384FED00
MAEPTDFDGLIEGYHRFRDGDWQRQRARWAQLAQGQAPRIMVIACSDSRVDPSQIFDVSPGEIFVVRNVANLVPPFETTQGHHGVSAALEFAVTQLNVSDVVVLGHGACGGVRASLDHAFAGEAPGHGGFIADWMSLIEEPRDRIAAELGKGPDAIRALELECVKVSLANLRSFPFVPEREAAGTLALRGAYFAIADGVLHLLDESTGTFAPA